METKEVISKFVNNEIDKLKEENEKLKNTIKMLKHENTMLKNKVNAMRGQKQKGLTKRRKWLMLGG